MQYHSTDLGIMHDEEKWADINQGEGEPMSLYNTNTKELRRDIEDWKEKSYDTWSQHEKDDWQFFLQAVNEDKRRRIIDAIRKALAEEPNLENLDNPYSRIAEHLPCGYDEFFPDINEEVGDSFEFTRRVEQKIDSIWSSI